MQKLKKTMSGEGEDSLQVLKRLLVKAPYLFNLCTLNPCDHTYVLYKTR